MNNNKNKELAEINEILSQLGFINENTPKPNVNSHINRNRKQSISNDNQKNVCSIRKPSLPSFPSGRNNNTGTDSNNSLKLNQINKSRKSLFYYDRSHSFNNISTNKIDNRKTIQNSDIINGFKVDEKLSDIERLEQQLSAPIHIYESLPLPSLTYSIDADSPNSNQYLEFKCPEATENIYLPSNRLVNPKNSLEIQRKLFTRQSHISENVMEEQFFSDEDLSSKLTSAPPSVRNSADNRNSKAQLIDLSIDSGFSSTIVINKLGFQSIEFSDYTDNQNISERISDTLSQCQYTTADENLFYLETDSMDANIKEDRNSKLDITRSENLAESKAINSEEERIKFFQSIAEEISLKTYSTKEIIRFYTSDGFTSQVIDISQTAASVCATLKNHLNKNIKSYYQIIEYIHVEGLERPLEDHENILNIFYSWKHENTCNRFLFRENPSIYKIFLKPDVFNDEMKCDFEIDDVIHVKEINGRWRKLFCFISDSTVYFKIKTNAKDPKDVYPLVNLKSFDIYTCTDSNKIKKSFKAPTNELIVFKSNKLDHKSQDHPCLCAFNIQQKEKWLEALKVTKFSFDQLKLNYLNFEKNAESISQCYSINNYKSSISTLKTGSI